MEAEDGYFKGSKMITTHWDGDWETFKQKFEASADLNENRGSFGTRTQNRT